MKDTQPARQTDRPTNRCIKAERTLQNKQSCDYGNVAGVSWVDVVSVVVELVLVSLFVCIVAVIVVSQLFKLFCSTNSFCFLN